MRRVQLINAWNVLMSKIERPLKQPIGIIWPAYQP